MSVEILNVTNENDDLTFTMKGVDVCFANALRRTVLSQIDRIAIDSIIIEDNTSTQFNNEILKERIKAIPVHLSLNGEDMHTFAKTHVLELDVWNHTQEKVYVTTEHFIVRNTVTSTVLDPTELRQLFQPYRQHYYIDLMRLLPGKGETIQGEHIKLKAQFGVHRAEENSCYSVVTKCAFHNTVNLAKAKEVLTELEGKWRSDGDSPEVISLRRRDFDALDKFRHFIPNSFDFVVRSIGIHDNMDLIVRACKVLQRRFEHLKTHINDVIVQPSHHVGNHPPSSMEHSLDIILKPGDTGGRISALLSEDEANECFDFHSVGYILDRLIYQNSMGKSVVYVGYSKFHPHNKEAVLRVAFKTGEGIEAQLKNMIVEACTQAQGIYSKVEQIFGSNVSK